MGLKRMKELLQEQNGLYKYSGRSKMYRKKYLMESVDEELLKKQMIEVLFERDYSIFDRGYSECFTKWPAATWYLSLDHSKVLRSSLFP